VAKYDVAIIGSGPGGYVAAIRAGELGLKTVVVEKDPFLGGTCLHIGCIPTKVLLHHAEVYDHFKNAAELGFEVSGLKINWANVLARKDKIVKKHAKGIEFLFKKNKVEWVQGWGKYEGPGRVSVEKDGKKTEIEASNILMVSGSEAKSLPGIRIFQPCTHSTLFFLKRNSMPFACFLTILSFRASTLAQLIFSPLTSNPSSAAFLKWS